MTTETLGPSQFERALDLKPGTLDLRTRALLERAALQYSTIDKPGQERLEAETAKQIDAGFQVVGEHRAGIWRDAWKEQLERFEQSGYSIEALNPKFVDGSTIMRWQGAYVRGITRLFELRFMEVLREWVYLTFLSDIGRLQEFGSGSAFNVAAYARLYPQVPIEALDWAPGAVRIAELLREKLGMKITGRKFDFFAPDPSFEIGADTGVFTMCALEQTGDRFGIFLDYLLAKRPKRVVHIEPILELYDDALPHDRLAILYHTRRKYLAGLLPRLQELSCAGKVHLKFVRRLRFGSRFHECFTIIAWEPA